MRKSNTGKFEVSFKQFVDYMTRKRINVAFVDKGFVDPLIAQVCRSFSRAKDVFGLSFEQLYDIFHGGQRGSMSKEQFLICAQGLQAEIAIEDLMEMFNYMDENQENMITKVQFVDALQYIANKLGVQSESQMNKSLAQTKKGGSSH